MTDVIFRIIPGAGGDVGKIILNRPQSLNALNLQMCIAIHQQLTQWQEQRSIKAVIITGAGDRAFCAGGDVRAVYELCAKQGRYDEAMVFFQQEYAMNQAIFQFSKPYVSFLDGITMGGGVGLSIHGSHSVATERLMWAMPETRIGFFPDVGTGYHLTRLSGHTGNYLALTGERALAGDVFESGLVTAVIPSSSLDELEKTLINTVFNSDDFTAVTQIINGFHHEPAAHLYTFRDHSPQINEHFSKNSIEEILSELTQSNDPWCKSTAAILAAQSPFSLKITHAHLQHCEYLNFPAVMAENSRLAKHLIRGHDFMEGVRAAVIDRDRHPHWLPANLAEITDAMVQHCFSD